MSSGLTESQSAQAVPPTHQVKVRSRSSTPVALERVISCRLRRSAETGRSWGTPAPERSGWRSSPRCCTSLWLFLEHQTPEIRRQKCVRSAIVHIICSIRACVWGVPVPRWEFCQSSDSGPSPGVHPSVNFLWEPSGESYKTWQTV